MAANIDCDILVAGAGPTGLSAAIASQDAGFSVAVVDKHKSGLPYSRACLVNSHTLALLKPYGIADKITSVGFPLASITIYGPNGVIIDGRFDIYDRSVLRPTALPQLKTENCFVDGLVERGITVQRPCALRSFNQKEDHVASVVEKDGRLLTIKSTYLLGADGYHSVVRAGLGVNYNRSKRPLLMYSQDAAINWRGRADVNTWILETGAAIANRIGDNRVRFAATGKEAFLATGLSDQIEQTTWETEFDVYFAQVGVYGDRRAWLAGDAAHVHSPVGGRGMNLGIADGVRFAKAVADQDFSGYQKDRHAVSGDRVRKNKLFTEIMSNKSFRSKIGRTAMRSLFGLVSIITRDNAAKKIFNAMAVG